MIIELISQSPGRHVRASGKLSLSSLHDSEQPGWVARVNHFHAPKPDSFDCHSDQARFDLCSHFRLPDGNQQRAFRVRSQKDEPAVRIFHELLGQLRHPLRGILPPKCEHQGFHRAHSNRPATPPRREPAARRRPTPGAYTSGMQRILVTGASTWVGGRLVRSLESRADTVVFAVDEIEPPIPFRSDFHLSSLDVLEFAEHVISVRPTTVVHLQTLDRSVLFGPDHSQSSVILGAQALFGAIGRLPEVHSVIVKSDTAVYGSGPRSPSVVNEETSPSPRLTRYERSLRDVEAAVSQLGSEHPEVTFTVLRFNPIIGASIPNPISRYLRLPVVPTLLGSDPRLQGVHEDDAVRALEHAIDHPTAGTFNVGGDGQLYLSRILRLGKRINQRLPARQLDQAMKVLRPFGASLPQHLLNLIKYGRVADTRMMQQTLGFQPRLNCRRMVLAAYGRLPDPAGG